MIIACIDKLQDKSLTLDIAGRCYEGLPIAVERGMQMSGDRFEINEFSPGSRNSSQKKIEHRKWNQRSLRPLNIFVAHPA